MITAYQFVKFKEDSFVEFHRQLAEQNTVSCFDFEDSIIDFKKNDTNAYKANYREKVVNLINKHKVKILKSWLGFRINEFGNNRYYDDIQALRALGDIKIRCIFLSNCHNLQILQNFIEDNQDIRFDEVIPIIESNDGFSNMEEIISFKHPKFKNVAFGHCDYNLSCNIFPFIHQDNPRYWYWIQKFEKLCKEHKIGFVNSVYLNVNHTMHFKLMLKNLSNHFKDFGQVTLNTQQSNACYSFKEDELINVRELNLLEDIDVMDYARKIVELFEKYNPDGMGYTIMPDTKIFISPQEYVAAKRHIFG
ncbi:MAG: hypothetical protein WHW07_02145 [Bacteroidales bacterium]|jgi:citrate lyase beta subunit|nr:aldolase/citrate lyase family protein [Bacteroidales bacterium]HOL98982.1 aldolase/citrate lyase family protein [Bacteroidales bacterium]HOM36806.1 aldolase/citrate lyase family protein [Bacteroidales bacterium]HPD24561.1 aldolase/citrate lyase family protein [Bacteroidales bacterium]HRS99519.1 aldolase/citrate lyase family protein [Bacteroidales bacterium]